MCSTFGTEQLAPWCGRAVGDLVEQQAYLNAGRCELALHLGRFNAFGG